MTKFRRLYSFSAILGIQLFRIFIQQVKLNLSQYFVPFKILNIVL